MRRCIAFSPVTAASKVLAAIAVAALPALGEASAQDWFALAGPGPDRTSPAETEDGGCSSVSPAPSPGCAAASGPPPLRPFRDPGLAFELGGGNSRATDLAIEGLAGYRPGSASKDGANFPVLGGRQPESARRSALSELLAPLGARPEIAGLGPLSPFIAGGLGAVRMKTGDTRMSFPKTGTIVPGEGRVGRAWTLTAGLAVAVGSRSTLELTWRYTDLGDVGTGPGSGEIEWRERGRTTAHNPAPPNVETTTHGVRLSLRYGF